MIREEWSDSTAMGTTVHVCVVGGPSAPIAEGAHAAVAEVDAALSAFRASSDVSRLNAAPGRWVPVGKHLIAVAEAAEDYRRLTRGVFDATLPAAGARTTGAAVADARTGDPDDTATPDAGPRLRWRPAGREWQAWLAPGRRLDFGAIAKGYAADLARDRCQARASGVLVSVGTSSIALAGRPPRRDAWRIAVGSPWDTVTETLGYVEASGGSFSMSGARGVRMSSAPLVTGHVVDPRTGRPARTDVCAVGVLAADGMTGEALSTAALVLGRDRGLALCRAHVADALVMTVGGEILATPAMAPRLSLRAGVPDALRRHRGSIVAG